MKIKNLKITAQCWAGISARGPTLLAWPSGPVGPRECWCRNDATGIELNRSIHGKLTESLDDTAVALSRRAHEHFPLQSVKDR
jgi:hypothetical protein